MKDVKVIAVLVTVCACAISCSTHPILSTQIVDLAPLHDLNFTHDFQSLDPAFGDYSTIVRNGVYVPTREKNEQGVVDWRRWSEQKYDFLGVRIDLILFDNIASATKRFDFDTQERSRFVSNSGEGENRYFSSSVRQDRSPDVIGHPPMGSFYSDVIVQKRNLLIYIHEQSNRRDAHNKDKYIPGIAAALKRLELEGVRS